MICSFEIIILIKKPPLRGLFYCAFYRALEQVIKARTTIKQFAQEIGMHRANLVNILHGKTKTPSLITISKILKGLGYTLSVESKLA